MRIHNTEEDFTRIKLLLNQYNLTEWPGSMDNFLLLGYKHLYPGAKETYQILRNLAINNFNSDNSKGYICQVSYDFLAVVLGTSKRTQISRIKSLEESSLIKAIKRYNSTNTYIVEPRPYPDSSFEETLKKILLRQECLKLIYEVKSVHNLKAYPDHWKKLSELYQTPFCKEVITDRFNEFKPIEPS